MRKKSENQTEQTKRPEVIPPHIAIIMDGNGRWAAKRLLPRSAGHKAGFDNFVSTVRECNNLGVSYLTVYAFSSENWQRDKQEVDYLIRLMNSGMINFLPELKEKNIRLSLFGDLTLFDEKSRSMLNHCVETLKDNTGMILSICLSYGGRQEILHAVNRLIADGKKNVTEADFKKYLYTAEVPDPDLIIRTSGEIRTSNFLLWQSAYAEYYFTDVLWPDFKKEELYKAINEFGKRNRRFGKI